MPWISVHSSSVTSAAERAATGRSRLAASPSCRRRRPTVSRSPENPPPSLRSPELFSSDAKLSAFCAAVAASFQVRTGSPRPSPGSSPARPCASAYNALMKSFSRYGDADEVMRLFNELKMFQPTPNALCYNTLINSLVVANRHDQALEMFDEMIASGVAPTTSSYTIFIKLLSFYPNSIDFAFERFRIMTESGCQPDEITYSTFIAGLCRAGRVEEALGLLDQMIENKLPLTVQAYTCIVQRYCSVGRFEVAKTLVSMMERDGCPPDVVTYSILIEALCEAGEFHEVEKVLMESEEKGWKPNEITYNIYMKSLCKAGKFDEVFQVLQVMRASDLRPTIVTLNILFDCLCRDSKLWEAKCLLERSSELEWDIDIFFFNTLMSRFCDLGELFSVLKLLAQMFKNGITPDTCTFTIVMRSLCKAGMLQQAKFVISSSCFVADIVAYNTLLHEFYMAQEFSEVQMLYTKMISENITPNKFTYCIMIDTLCREGKYLGATDWFITSLKIGFFPDLVTRDLVTRLNNWLVKGGKLSEIVNLAHEISIRGLVIDVSIFTSLIRVFCREGFCKSSNMFGVCLILEKMLGMR